MPLRTGRDGAGSQGWAAAAASLLALSCRTVLGLEDLDRLQRSVDACTTVAMERYTLWSPFDVVATRDWMAMLDQELPAMASALDTQLEQPLLVLLTPVEGLSPQMSVEKDVLRIGPPGEHPLHGVEGHALDRQVVLFVDAPTRLPVRDGRMVMIAVNADTYRKTLRHELAHVFAGRAGIRGADWLSEGSAQYLASLTLIEGCLEDAGTPVDPLIAARRLPPERRTIASLLAWQEDGAQILAGEERVDPAARTLCGLFVRFLVAREDDVELADRLRAVSALRPDELLVLEEPWQSWLEGLDQRR